MRPYLIVLALLFGALLTGSTQAQTASQRDWRTAIRQTPTGAHIIGNPAAKVKLVEYLSYTCPHCAAFVAESKPELLDGMVRRGSVSLEVRHAVRDGLDLSAAMLVRCTGPANFVAAHNAVFANQEAMLAKAQAYRPAEGASQAAQLAGLADASGVTALIRPRLKTAPQACLAATADRAKLVAMAEAAFAKIQGTPSFEVNGTLVPGNDWASLKPRLLTAGAR
ncbi:thioredoxin domain-containing protein [Sphingomonas qomolangmaensis]|uniref:DsbA family protein n=1 Tax=Sphingomonas qomolangmaensis TaxID=2918765 RepID=A0ABY5L5S5_9SPHN|nr:thioredoxin domain-containing protein [Sphingomonas qomolangmaensis]UUL81817.1 DsbA family protein [Sphingomonas qomolangmaensis]